MPNLDEQHHDQFLRLFAEHEAALHTLLRTMLPSREDAGEARTAHRTGSSRDRTRLCLAFLAAAAAGIVVGTFCTSVVFAYVAPSMGKVITLLRESFESGPAPLVNGVPMATGRWSGDYTEIVGEHQAVKPLP